MPNASSSRRSPERSVMLRRCAAAAAVIAGTAWIFKAGLTLATGNEPPAAFAIGLALLPFALLGLWSLVRGVPGRSAPIGGVLAAAAAISVIVATLVRANGGADVEPSEDEITALTPFIAVAGFGTFAALFARSRGAPGQGVARALCLVAVDHEIGDDPVADPGRRLRSPATRGRSRGSSSRTSPG